MGKIYCYVYTVSDVSLCCNSNNAFDLLLLACNVGLLGNKAAAAKTVSQDSSISKIPTMLVF